MAAETHLDIVHPGVRELPPGGRPVLESPGVPGLQLQPHLLAGRPRQHVEHPRVVCVPPRPLGLGLRHKKGEAAGAADAVGDGQGCK